MRKKLVHLYFIGKKNVAQQLHFYLIQFCNKDHKWLFINEIQLSAKTQSMSLRKRITALKRIDF